MLWTPEQASAAHRKRPCVKRKICDRTDESVINAARFQKLEQERHDQEAAASPGLRERYARACTGFWLITKAKRLGTPGANG